MDDKEELLQAIDNYSLYTKAQRRVLRTLVNVEIDNKASIDVLTLSKISQATSTAVYKTIKLLEKDNVLQVLPSANKRMNIFLLKKNRLEEIKHVANKIFNLSHDKS